MKQKTIERILLFFIAFAVVSSFMGAINEQRRKSQGAAIATPAPKFNWRDLDGKQHELTSPAGKVVIIHFWATWCGPCRTEFPELLKAAELLKNDAVFITISSDENLEKARSFVEAAQKKAGLKPANVLYGHDAMKMLTYDMFQVQGLPETIIIDPSLVMRRKFSGTINWHDPKVLEYIRDLKNMPAPIKSTSLQ